uniref:Uncharacterized protein n=1 Tax=Candidozyma auris TaxID=498019 RepID=A0A0L0NUJ7_CANAR
MAICGCEIYALRQPRWADLWWKQNKIISQFLSNMEPNGLTPAVNSLSLLLYFIVVVALASFVLFVFS